MTAPSNVDPDESTRTKIASEALQHFSQRIGDAQICQVLESRDLVMNKLRKTPESMHKLTRQTELALDMIEDYWSGTYRRVPWYTMAMAVAALLYSINPVDVVPDHMPGLGRLDDVFVIGLAMRVLERDLEAYCSHKGLSAADYF